MAARLSALRAGSTLPPGRFMVAISVRSWVDPRTVMRLEGLGQLKNVMTKSQMYPAIFRLVRIMPQPSTLPRTRSHMNSRIRNIWGHYAFYIINLVLPKSLKLKLIHFIAWLVTQLIIVRVSTFWNLFCRSMLRQSCNNTRMKFRIETKLKLHASSVV
jgi:hypothetical protein